MGVIPEAVHYRESSDPAVECGTCVFFQNGHCSMFDADVSISAVCDKWRAITADHAVAQAQTRVDVINATMQKAYERVDTLEDHLTEAITPILAKAGEKAARTFESQTVPGAPQILPKIILPPLRRVVTASVRPRPLVLTSAAVEPDSAMVAVYPRPDEAQALAEPGGEKPEQMHVTLVYLGKPDEETIKAIGEALGRVGGEHPPLEGHVGGVGGFAGNGDGVVPAILLPDVRGLTELRQAVAHAVVGADADFARDHGYTPHITVAYRDGETPPSRDTIGQPLHFDAVHLVQGDKALKVVPLTGVPALTAAGKAERTTQAARVEETAAEALAERVVAAEEALQEAETELNRARQRLRAAQDVGNPVDVTRAARELADAQRNYDEALGEVSAAQAAGEAGAPPVTPLAPQQPLQTPPPPQQTKIPELPEQAPLQERVKAGLESGDIEEIRQNRRTVDRAIAGFESGLRDEQLYEFIQKDVDLGVAEIKKVLDDRGILNQIEKAPPLPPATWKAPAADELLHPSILSDEVKQSLQPIVMQLISTVQDPIIDSVGLNFDAKNPFTAKVIANAGQQITNITQTTQHDVMNVIDKSYQDGLSIPHTADAIRDVMKEASPARARLIARTELAGAVNGGGLAATQIISEATGDSYTKQWMTAPGAKYPRHEDYAGLDGQTRALHETFDVGDASLQFPGDPEGPPGEVCNCRCTLAYLLGGQVEGTPQAATEAVDVGDNGLPVEPTVGPTETNRGAGLGVPPGGPVYKTSDPEVAALGLAQGKNIELQHPDEIATVLDDVAAQAQKAKAAGIDAGPVDFGHATVRGTNLFTQDSLGIPRAEMPQLGGVPVPGSIADALPRNSRGEVDISTKFYEHLKNDLGVNLHDTDMLASHMRATQNQIDGRAVAGIMHAMDKGVKLEGRIPVSVDGYVIDGHHRWAAEIGENYKGGVDRQLTIPVTVIDEPVTTILKQANEFAAKMGLPSKTLGTGMPASVLAGKGAAKVAETAAKDAIDAAKKDPIFGVTPFREGEDNPIGFYTTAKAKQFEADIQASAKQYHLDITSSKHVQGVWDGGGEPSYQVHADGTPEDVAKFAEDMRARYNQDSVGYFTPKTDLPKGVEADGVAYTIHDVDPAAAQALLGKYNIPGATAFGHQIQIWGGAADAEPVAAMAKELNGKVTARPGKVSWINRPETHTVQEEYAQAGSFKPPDPNTMLQTSGQYADPLWFQEGMKLKDALTLDLPTQAFGQEAASAAKTKVARDLAKSLAGNPDWEAGVKAYGETKKITEMKPGDEFIQSGIKYRLDDLGPEAATIPSKEAVWWLHPKVTVVEKINPEGDYGDALKVGQQTTLTVTNHNDFNLGEQPWPLPRSQAFPYAGPGQYKAENLVYTDSEQAVGGLVNLWMQTAADDDPWSIAIQRAAEDELGTRPGAFGILRGRSNTALLTADKIYAVRGPALRAFVRAEYDNTQKFLNDRGIKDLTLYRGQANTKTVGGKILEGGNYVDSIEFQPLSSFSADVGTAAGFTGGERGSAVIATQVPASRVISCPLTGAGCLDESEFIVGAPADGAPTDLARVSVTNDYLGIGSGDKFWKDQQMGDAAGFTEMPTTTFGPAITASKLKKGDFFKTGSATKKGGGFSYQGVQEGTGKIIALDGEAKVTMIDPGSPVFVANATTITTAPGFKAVQAGDLKVGDEIKMPGGNIAKVTSSNAAGVVTKSEYGAPLYHDPTEIVAFKVPPPAASVVPEGAVKLSAGKLDYGDEIYQDGKVYQVNTVTPDKVVAFHEGVGKVFMPSEVVDAKAAGKPQIVKAGGLVEGDHILYDSHTYIVTKTDSDGVWATSSGKVKKFNLNDDVDVEPTVYGSSLNLGDTVKIDGALGVVTDVFPTYVEVDGVNGIKTVQKADRVALSEEPPFGKAYGSELKVGDTVAKTGATYTVADIPSAIDQTNGVPIQAIDAHGTVLQIDKNDQVMARKGGSLAPGGSGTVVPATVPASGLKVGDKIKYGNDDYTVTYATAGQGPVITRDYDGSVVKLLPTDHVEVKPHTAGPGAVPVHLDALGIGDTVEYKGVPYEVIEPATATEPAMLLSKVPNPKYVEVKKGEIVHLVEKAAPSSVPATDLIEGDTVAYEGKEWTVYDPWSPGKESAMLMDSAGNAKILPKGDTVTMVKKAPGGNVAAGLLTTGDQIEYKGAVYKVAFPESDQGGAVIVDSHGTSSELPLGEMVKRIPKATGTPGPATPETPVGEKVHVGLLQTGDTIEYDGGSWFVKFPASGGEGPVIEDENGKTKQIPSHQVVKILQHGEKV